MKILVAAVLAAALLTGCGSDDRQCLSGHNEEYTWMMPVYTGTVNNVPMYTYIPQAGERFVCDEYAVEATDATG